MIRRPPRSTLFPYTTPSDLSAWRGKWNSQCSGEMRRYWEEHRWRRRLILTNGLCGFAQVTIEECQRRAQEHYPLVRQYVQIEEAEASRLANAGKGYLPQVKLSGNASYRSEVTRLPFDASQWGIPGLDIPALSKDQYALSLDALQVLLYFLVITFFTRTALPLLG